ncbi:MAG: GTP cyclohydrolase, FolE2/MptA family, partial [Methanobacterium sp.]
GINMSRLGRTIMESLSSTKYSSNPEDHTLQSLMGKTVKQLKEANKSSTAYLKAKFSYPLDAMTYASKLTTTEYVDVVWEAIIDENETVSHIITVETVGLSLCPCSKEMSLLTNNLDPKEKEMFDKFKKEGDDLWPTMKSFIKKIEMAGFGAHNQRSTVRITLAPLPGQLVWFEDIVNIANNSFSSPILNILKREDEKVEGEMGYLGGYYAEDSLSGCVTFNEVEGTGPKFVEDIARDAAKQLDIMLDKTINDYVVTCRNAESIHSRDLEAVAILTAGRQLM